MTTGSDGSHREQIPLPLRHDGDLLGRYLEKIVRQPIRLTFTDNTTVMLSVRMRGKGLSVRLHRMFLDAGRDVLCEVGRFVTERRGRTPLLREFIRLNEQKLRTRRPREVRVRTEGRYHDLSDTFRSVNDAYFDGTISCRITWGVKRKGYAARKRTLGSYDRRTDTIRVNPLLDQKRVPRYYLAFVVYHEMLHADMECGREQGRRTVHSREFRERERAFREYERAVAWEQRRL